jgi:hypothetical protein
LRNWSDDALFRPEVREAYRRLVAQGWVDAVRTMHPGKRVYTFWKYFRNAFERDAGLRIDHFLLSPSLATRLTSANVDRDVRARENASDHAPVWIMLIDKPSWVICLKFNDVNNGATKQRITPFVSVGSQTKRDRPSPDEIPQNLHFTLG